MFRYRGQLYRRIDWSDRIGHVGFRRAVTTLWQTFEDLVEHLGELDVDPVLVGGLAVQHYGYTRMTEDIDILIDRSDYNRLVESGKIQYGQLRRFQPGVQVDVLTEGRDGAPAPDDIRDPDSPWLPTLAGLIHMKLISDRMKDQADVVELLKANDFDPDIRDQLQRLDSAQLPEFDRLFTMAQMEQGNE
ncbi:hypothetical protein LCGC14_0468930 [marine sediment metagenome]|uniref:Uncharacterized protein n=1 Tax=marine sediment metagenome TaxID=412755 RepID=A0A0F9SVN3_9ZZZZ